jgi:hypothetical protein
MSYDRWWTCETPNEKWPAIVKELHTFLAEATSRAASRRLLMECAVDTGASPYEVNRRREVWKMYEDICDQLTGFVVTKEHIRAFDQRMKDENRRCAIYEVTGVGAELAVCVT